MKVNRVVSRLLLLGATCLSHCVASAGLFTFTGQSGNDWFDPGNWDPAQVPTAEDDVMIAGESVVANGSISVGSITVAGNGILEVNAPDASQLSVKIVNDLSLADGAKVTFRAGRTSGLDVTKQAESAALLWANANPVNVGGKLTVAAGCTLFCANHPETGTPVLIRCGELAVAEGGTISTVQLGPTLIKGSPLDGETANTNIGVAGYYTFAFGAGNSFGNGPGYGGVGNNGSYGRAYGYQYAPFLPGSPNGLHSTGNKAPLASGSICIQVAGHAMIAGMLTADGKADQMYGGPSGGGIWVTAATGEITETARLSADGALCSGNYDSAGPGGRIALGFGLTDSDIAALAAGQEPEDLAYTDIYGFASSVLGGFKKNGSGGRANPGTAKIVFRPTAAKLCSITGSPSNMGEVEPSYGFHVFATGRVPEFTAPETIYPAGYRNMRRYAGITKSEVEGAQPGVVWNFAGDQFFVMVRIVGSGSVSFGGETYTESFTCWCAANELAAFTASGDFAGWYGDIPGGFAADATLETPVDGPMLVQAVFGDATGVAREYAGAAGGFWEEATNWTPAGVPTPLDDLTVPAGKFVRGLNTLAARSLTVAGFVALGGELNQATTKQTLSDVGFGFSGLCLTGDLAVSGGLTLGSLSHNAVCKAAVVGGNATLSSTGTLAVYAPTHGEAITPPFAANLANRQVFEVKGDFSVADAAVVYPVGDPLTGTPVEWRVGGDFTLAEGAKVNADNLGYDWLAVDDSRNVVSAVEKGVTYQSFSPGLNSSSYTGGGCHGAGTLAYGNPYAPYTAGAPSSVYGTYDAGGGVVWLTVAGAMHLSGTISANTPRHGANCYSGGAGGSVWLIAKKFFADTTAKVSAEGGIQCHGGVLTGAGTGGRVAVCVGMTDEDVENLLAGVEPSEAGLVTSEGITLFTVSVRGGRYSKKGAGNVDLYGESGTAWTISGAAADTVVTVYGTPFAVKGEDGPDYGPFPCPQGQPATFTASAVASLDGEEETVRYNLKGWVVSNATEEVARGAGATATFDVGKDALALTWIWGDRETQTKVVANRSERGSILVKGETGESGSAWVGADPVEFTAVPSDGAEFLYWVGDVPQGQTLANPIRVSSSKARRLTAVFRTAEPPTNRVWKGEKEAAGNWYDEDKWEPKGLPGLDDDVVIEGGWITTSNCVAVGSLRMGWKSILRVASVTVNKGYDRFDVDELPSAGSGTRSYANTALEEALVSVNRDLVLADTAQIAVGTRGATYRANVEVGGDLLLTGTNKFVLAAGPIDENFTLATGAGHVTVGGRFYVGDGSVVHPICEHYTGGTVVFKVGEFELAEGGEVFAATYGYCYDGSRVPATYAPGAGLEHQVGGGYGGTAFKTSYTAPETLNYGNPYGNEFAPIHPGSPLGGWGGVCYGGGLIRIHAGKVTINGTLNARGKDPNASGQAQKSSIGSGSGGGIWVTCAGKPVIGATAKFLANGADRATGAGRAGGGGRIALAANVTAEQVAELAATGTVAAWKQNGKHFVNKATFEAQHPGVTVNVDPGEVGQEGCYDENGFGTFWYVDGIGPGLVLWVR